MMTQTLAIFLDAYRELNSKKLFWIVLAITLAVVVALAIPTQHEKGISVFTAKLDFPILSTEAVSAKGFYTFLFSWFGINLWLAWGATILALISTAGMIPDLVTGGSIDLVLSRPIGRIRLFLMKYLAGLLFVGLQAAVFAVGAVLVIGIRGGEWGLKPLLVIPLMMAFFSYLHCISALVGLITRSTLMALLATLLAWLGIWGVSSVETIMLDQRRQSEREVTRMQEQLTQLETLKDTLRQRIEAIPPAPATAPSAPSEPPASGESAQPEPPSPGNGDAAWPAGSPKPPPPPERPRGSQRRDGVKRVLDEGNRLIAASASGDPLKLEAERTRVQRQIDELNERLPDRIQSRATMTKWHRGLYASSSLLPKTGETKSLFSRYVVDEDDMEGFLKMLAKMTGDPDAGKTESEIGRRGLWWVLGTSFAFELVVLSIALWIFCRRDF